MNNFFTQIIIIKNHTRSPFFTRLSFYSPTMSLECIEKLYIKQKWMVRWLLSSLKNSSTMLSVQYTAHNNNNPPEFFHVYMQVYFSIERIFFNINLRTFLCFLFFLFWNGMASGFSEYTLLFYCFMCTHIILLFYYCFFGAFTGCWVD